MCPDIINKTDLYDFDPRGLFLIITDEWFDHKLPVFIDVQVWTSYDNSYFDGQISLILLLMFQVVSKAKKSPELM